MRMNELVVGFDQIKNIAPKETSCGIINFSTSISNEKALLKEKTNVIW